MKNLDEKMEKYIVVSREGYEEYFITKRDNFEETNFCECKGDYGQDVGCYNAGCYSIDNSESSAKNDCITALYEHFNIEYTKDDCDDQHFDGATYGDNDLLSEIEQDKIDSFIESWKNKNEVHTQVTAWTYWDGSNHTTLVLNCDFGEPDVNEIEEEEEGKILAEFTGPVDVFQGAAASEETENYKFTTTRWASDPWLATVESI